MCLEALRSSHIYFHLWWESRIEKFEPIYKECETVSRIPATKGKVCSSCISRGTISRSSLESRIRFLPSSMAAKLAFWSPPGTAEAGTPPPIAPSPGTLFGIAVVYRSIVSIDYRSVRWRVHQSQAAAERHSSFFGQSSVDRLFVRSCSGNSIRRALIWQVAKRTKVFSKHEASSGERAR